MTARATGVYEFANTGAMRIPLFSFPVPAGKPADLDNHIEKWIDLNKHLVKHPAATFLVPVEGDSMEDAGITSGDLLVVDRSAEPHARSIVIVDVDGDLTVKRLSQVGGRLWLVPASEHHNRQEIKGQQHCSFWGVVTHIIKKA